MPVATACIHNKQPAALKVAKDMHMHLDVKYDKRALCPVHARTLFLTIIHQAQPPQPRLLVVGQALEATHQSLLKP